MITHDAIRALIKASFSGDRSAAGRYAAEQRWKDHVKSTVPADDYALFTKKDMSETRDRQQAIADKLGASGCTFGELQLTWRMGAILPAIGTEWMQKILNDKSVLGAKNGGEFLVAISKHAKDRESLLTDIFGLRQPDLMHLESTPRARSVIEKIANNWTGSPDDDEASLVKQAAIDVFGPKIVGKEEPQTVRDDRHTKEWRDAYESLPFYRSTIQKAVKAIYDDTQEQLQQLRANGVTHVILYRGTQLERGTKESGPLRALTSWTTNYEQAGRYSASRKKGTNLAERTIEATFPLSQIFGLMNQGFGGQTEQEVLVLGPKATNSRVLASFVYPEPRTIDELMEKESFGGDRSAAGRYAAEQRWKNHVKQETGARTKGAQDFLRLNAGTAQTYTEQYGIYFAGVYPDGEQEEGQFGGHDTQVFRKTTPKQFRQWVEDGVVPTTPQEKERILRMLDRYGEDQPVQVEMKLIEDAVRKPDFQPVRPDEPHDPRDVKAIHSGYLRVTPAETSGMEDMRQVESRLIVNTSPKNHPAATAATIKRWEKAWENDWDNSPYCNEIAGHAAFQMGEIPSAPKQRELRGKGFRTPDPQMLAMDANNLLTAINDGRAAQPVLWRGFYSKDSERKAALANAQTGDTFTISLGASSRDALMASKYASAAGVRNSEQVILRIEEGSKGVSVNKGVYVHDQEVITSGKFEVIETETVRVPSKTMHPWGGVHGSSESSQYRTIAALKLYEQFIPPQKINEMRTKLEAGIPEMQKLDTDMTSVKIISVRQVATFDPVTKEWEANG